MNAVIVYVGAKIEENFRHGINEGIWGFKPGKQPKKPFVPGDWVVFGRGANPRASEANWFTQTLTEVVLAKTTTDLTIEKSPEWPDEKRSGLVKYPWRFRFSETRRISGSVRIDSIERTLAEAMRSSGIRSEGYVVPISAPPFEATNRQPQSPSMPPPPSIPKSTAEKLLEIENFIRSRGFNFDQAILTRFYASLRAKPFVILAGNSGTGKSRLARLFAEAIGANIKNGQFLMVPVRPDWNDSSELLGYNDINGDFRPGLITSIVLRAHAQEEKPFFLCLDEMNLARVEHYFSDFLSIIESRQKLDKRVSSDPLISAEQIARIKTDALPKDLVSIVEDLRAKKTPIMLPSNLIIVGTVNMDETTQPFSRKVLDRANTLEFAAIDLEEGIEEESFGAPVPCIERESDFVSAEYITLKDVDPPKRKLAREIAEFLNELNRSLVIAGFEIGYRVRDEAISFAIYALDAGMSLPEIQESIILQKILPRVQGSSPRLERVLLSLMEYCSGQDEIPDPEAPDFIDKLAALRAQEGLSAVLRKLSGMTLIYKEEGFTSFWLV